MLIALILSMAIIPSSAVERESIMSVDNYSFFCDFILSRHKNYVISRMFDGKKEYNQNKASTFCHLLPEDKEASYLNAETETTTMFGLRVKHLLRSADSISFEKNGVKADLPAATLKVLNQTGSDKLAVTIDGADAENAKVTVTVNGKAVDINGIASSTPEEPEEEKDTTYRWNFDNLNEANGLNNLTDSKKSTKAYKFEEGMIIIDSRTTDFELTETISLSPRTD